MKWTSVEECIYRHRATEQWASRTPVSHTSGCTERLLTSRGPHLVGQLSQQPAEVTWPAGCRQACWGTEGPGRGQVGSYRLGKGHGLLRRVCGSLQFSGFQSYPGAPSSTRHSSMPSAYGIPVRADLLHTRCDCPTWAFHCAKLWVEINLLSL